MKKRIFVTATNTDIGKTYTSKLLLKAFASRGLKVGAIKLIETGVKEFAPDANTLLETLQELNHDFLNLSVEDIVPLTYELPAAPYIASNKKALNLDALDKAVSKLEALCEVLIIEGAGGLYVPIDEKYMMIDMITHFKATALLVTHCSLGCINDTLLSQKALKDRDITYMTAFNCREEDTSFEVVSEPYFKDIEQKVLKTSEDIDTICDVLYNL
jgi:dethiobiotin synthetase